MTSSTRMSLGLLILFMSFHLSSFSQDSILWKYSCNGAIYSSATLTENAVYIGSVDGNLYALDKSSGSLLWKFTTKGQVRSTSAVAAGNIFFQSSDGVIYSLNKDSGKQNWCFTTHGEQRYDLWDYYLSSPVVVEGILYAGSGDSSIYAIEASTGNKVWCYKTQGVVHATPMVHDGTVYIGSFDGNFYALSAQSGALKWKFKTVGDVYFPLGEIQKSAVLFDNTVIFGSRDYNIYAVDTKTGTGHWNFKEKGSWIIASPFIFKQDVYFGTSDSHRFYCMNARNGEVKWTIALNMRVYGSACSNGSDIIFGCFNGKMYFADSESGKINAVFQTEASKKFYYDIYSNDDSFRKDFELYGKDIESSEKKILALGSILATPAIEDNILYFGDSNGDVYALKINYPKKND